MSFRRSVIRASNTVLNRIGLHITSKYHFDELESWYKGEISPPVPLPLGAAEYLSWKNPRLVTLSRLYSQHPAAQHTQWSDEHLKDSIELTKFRGDNHYVYQTRYSPAPSAYALTYMYVKQIDKLRILNLANEDGLFGAYTIEVEGRKVSRDLLDSVNQINYIARTLDVGINSRMKILDIGAGYGRLGHRFATSLPNSRVTCTDAVALSTSLCEYYISLREVSDRVNVLSLDQMDVVRGKEFDLATNIHSFSEAPLAAIEWWFSLLDDVRVSRLLIVPNRLAEFKSTEKDGGHLDYLPILAKHSWRQVHAEPIYAHSEVAQAYALYPNFKFYMFERVI